MYIFYWLINKLLERSWKEMEMGVKTLLEAF